MIAEVVGLDPLYIHIVYWRMESPMNKLFTLGERLFNPPKQKHVLQRAESHRCEVNTLGTFACNFSIF